MRKILVFITLIMALCFISANAQSFQVEKASKVKLGDQKVKVGMSLKNNEIVTIDNNGYLLLVDKKSKNRYYVNYPCRSKIANLIKKAQSPITVTKSFLDTVLSSRRTNTDYASAGSVYRGEENEELMPLVPAEMLKNDAHSTDSIPNSIEIDSSMIEGETITLYFVLP